MYGDEANALYRIWRSPPEMTHFLDATPEHCPLLPTPNVVLHMSLAGIGIFLACQSNANIVQCGHFQLLRPVAPVILPVVRHTMPLAEATSEIEW